MTINDIFDSDRITISCEEVASVLKCNPQSLREQIREDSAKVGFNTIQIGSRIYIPRQAFIDYLIKSR